MRAPGSFALVRRADCTAVSLIIRIGARFIATCCFSPAVSHISSALRSLFKTIDCYRRVIYEAVRRESANSAGPRI